VLLQHGRVGLLPRLDLSRSSREERRDRRNDSEARRHPPRNGHSLSFPEP
jgi:hypothetical protein